MNSLLILFQTRLQTTVRPDHVLPLAVLTSTDVILDIPPQATQQQIRDGYKKYVHVSMLLVLRTNRLVKTSLEIAPRPCPL